MRKIIPFILLIWSVSIYAQPSFADIIKATKLGAKSTRLDVEGLCNLKKASVYNDQVIVDVTNNKIRPLATALCPNLMYDVKLTDMYYAEKKRIELMKDLLNEEPNLKKLAAGFFLIGQYAYLEKKYEIAAKALKVSKDLFTLNKATKLVLARVEMVATLAELQTRDDIDMERFVLRNGELLIDDMSGKSLLNLMMYLQSNSGTSGPCDGKIDPNSSSGLLIRVYNIYWQFSTKVLIRLKYPFRTAYKTNSLSDVLTEKKYTALKVRAFSDPLMNAFWFNTIMGVNDLVNNHQEDEDLLRHYATVSDFILTKNDLNYQLATSTATLDELHYDPVQPEKLKKKLLTAIQKSPRQTIAKSLLYRHLATLFYTQNQPDSAAFYIKKTYRIQKKILPNLSPAREKLVQGFLTYLEGDYPKAKALCEEALAAQTDDPTRTYTLHTLGLIHRAEQDVDLAIRRFEQSVNLIETQTNGLKREYSKEFFIQMTYDAYENLIGLYREQNRLEETFDMLLKNQNNIFQQSLSRQIYGTSDEEALQIISGFYHLLTQGEKEHNRLRLSTEISNKNTALTLDGIKKHIGKDEVMLVFGFDDENLFCMIYSDDKFVIKTLCTKAELIKDMTAFQEDFVKHCRKQQGDITGKEFFKIIRPIYQHIWKDIENSGLINDKKLLIQTSQYLHTFPFEMLINDDTPKPIDEYNYLIQKNIIRYFSGEIRDASKNTYTKDFLGFGNPVFTGSNFPHEIEYNELGYVRNRLSPLPNTQDEIDSIATKFPPARIDTYTGKFATEDALKKLSNTGVLKDYRYIHFATHGIVDYENYQLSSIALTQDKNTDEDGFLQFFEIDREQIGLEAELVVLSACETALGKNIVGIGTMNFSKALFGAGAKSAILSQWQVFRFLMVKPQNFLMIFTPHLRKIQIAIKKKYCRK